MRPFRLIVFLDLSHMLSDPFPTMNAEQISKRAHLGCTPQHRGANTQLLAGDPEHSRSGTCANFQTSIRGKVSACIDLKYEVSDEVFCAPVRQAYIVFENFGVGATQPLGIHHNALAAVIHRSHVFHHRLRPDRPKMQRPASDRVVKAMGGAMSITGSINFAPMRRGNHVGFHGHDSFEATSALTALQVHGSPLKPLLLTPPVPPPG